MCCMDVDPKREPFAPANWRTGTARSESNSEGREDPGPDVDALLGPRWKRRLPLGILTLAPTAYFTTKIWLRTGDLLLAVGAGVVCPFVIYVVFGAWLDESSRFTKSSWARWCANHSERRTLLCAVIGALVFTGFFALLWFAGSAVTRY
jgi:hypothetical protein